MRSKFVLPLPRFVFHPLTAAAIAAIHVYLAYGHLSALTTGEVMWIHIWKGFGALFGAYVFAALASRRMPAWMQHARPEFNSGQSRRTAMLGAGRFGIDKSSSPQ
jgi:hypothetical protein